MRQHRSKVHGRIVAKPSNGIRPPARASHKPLVRYVGLSAIPRGKVSRAKGPVERCPLCGKFPESPLGHNPMGGANISVMRCRLLGISVLCVSALAADLAGLQPQSETKITAQMVGAPFEGDKPPFVWAMSFSPDGKRLALGVQFAQKRKERSFQSYLVLLPADRPSVVLARFDTPTQVEVGNLHTIVWSGDGKFLAVSPWGDSQHAAVLDTDTGQLHHVETPQCGRAEGVVSGPRILQRCTLGNFDSAIRFLGVNGNAAPDWTFHGLVNLLQLSPDRKMLALDIPDLRDQTRPIHPHEIVLFNIADRSEISRWSLAEAGSYGGSFAAFGAEFCTVADPNTLKIHEIVCRSVKAGEVTSKSGLPRGPVRLSAAGDKLMVSRTGVVMLPFRMFDTNVFFKGGDQYLLSARTGQTFARWRAPPMYDVNFASAVSESGETVAIADSARLRVYRVAQ